MRTERNDLRHRRLLQELADRALGRAGGAPSVAKNQVRLLKDAGQNYPAWLEAIKAARHHIHFESYIIYEDDTGQEFARALIAKAHEGVCVRLIYDWMGGFGKASKRFWDALRAGGVEVRCYNPPRFDSPFGWLSRDHRKMLTVDGRVGFISGLCVGRMWVGEPQRSIQPWRDTGIEMHGPALAEIEQAFANIWASIGEPIPQLDLVNSAAAPAGNMDVRVVASLPGTAGMIRVDQLVAALARKRLWLTDAYFAGTSSYVQAMRAAAKDSVDVRLLVPNATDIPLLQPLSRAGYRPLLQAGVRIFEWNGTMIHAKTAVADGYWGRVGSTNLNVASWFNNCELDVIVEDDSFGRQMEQMYLEDLSNATEIVLDTKQKVLAPGEPRHPYPSLTSGGGSTGRAAAGAIRVGNALGAAFTNHRVLEPVEANIMLTIGACLLALAIIFACFPRISIYPFVVVLTWIAVTLLYRGYKLRFKNRSGMD